MRFVKNERYHAARKTKQRIKNVKRVQKSGGNLTYMRGGGPYQEPTSEASPGKKITWDSM